MRREIDILYRDKIIDTFVVADDATDAEIEEKFIRMMEAHVEWEEA